MAIGIQDPDVCSEREPRALQHRKEIKGQHGPHWGEWAQGARVLAQCLCLTAPHGTLGMQSRPPSEQACGEGKVIPVINERKLRLGQVFQLAEGEPGRKRARHVVLSKSRALPTLLQKWNRMIRKELVDNGGSLGTSEESGWVSETEQGTAGNTGSGALKSTLPGSGASDCWCVLPG